MPAGLLKSFADRSGVSLDKVEGLWQQAKKKVEHQYGMREPEGEDKSDGRYYKLVVGILRQMLNLNKPGDK